jgi:hypothetical protein
MTETSQQIKTSSELNGTDEGSFAWYTSAWTMALSQVSASKTFYAEMNVAQKRNKNRIAT